MMLVISNDKQHARQHKQKGFSRQIKRHTAFRSRNFRRQSEREKQEPETALFLCRNQITSVIIHLEDNARQHKQKGFSSQITSVIIHFENNEK